MRLKIFIASLVAASFVAASANAAVIFQYVLDPATTAGGGSTSTQSGANRYHLYALDNTAGSMGISAYNIQLSNVSTNLHRTPQTAIEDANENTGNAGFTLARTGNNTNPMIGSQPALGNLTQLTGFGREANTFAAKLPGYLLSGTQTSLAWGSNTTKPTNTFPDANLPWMLIAEGQYLAGGPGLVLGAQGTNVNLYNANFGQFAAEICLRGGAETCGIPTGPTGVAPDIGDLNEGLIPRNAVTGLGPLPVLNVPNPAALTWELVSFTGSGEPSDAPASVNPATGEFSWDTNGSTSVGAYSAVIRATNSAGSDTATLSFTTFVPEPASIALFGIAMVGGLGLVRRRNG